MSKGCGTLNDIHTTKGDGHDIEDTTRNTKEHRSISEG
jgi:hypothetical protein